jgi:hypothetical protein
LIRIDELDPPAVEDRSIVGDDHQHGPAVVISRC